MSDLHDLRIKAFVTELLEDPPATPSFAQAPGAVLTGRSAPSRPHWVPRRIRGPVVAVAAFASLIVAGAVSVLLQFGVGTPDRTVTETPPPSAPAATAGSFLGIPTDVATPFTARVTYSSAEWTPATSTRRADIVVSFFEPRVFRLELESVEADTGPASLVETTGIAVRTGAGSYFISDGTNAASFLAARNLFLRLPPSELDAFDLDELAWSHWAERCGAVDHEVIDETTVLSRPVIHVRCAELGGDINVWVDKETGVVMNARIAPSTRSVGDFPIAGEFGILTDSFNVISIEFGELTSDRPSVLAPDGSFEHQADRRVRWIVAGNADCDVECAEADLSSLASFPLVGSPAPPLTGVRLDGTSFDLADLRGTKVALLWWASWVGTSVDQLAEFDRLAQDRPDIEFVSVLGGDQRDQAAKVAERGGISVPIVDTGDTGPNWDWQVEGIPTTVLIEMDGTVIFGLAGAWPAGGLSGLLEASGW